MMSADYTAWMVEELPEKVFEPCRRGILPDEEEGLDEDWSCEELNFDDEEI